MALTLDQKGVTKARRDRYWLYVVTRCKQSEAPQIVLLADPARLAWHDVKQVEHDQFSVSALMPASSKDPRT